MIWRDEVARREDAREHQRKLEYARELEQQIEQRQAIEREEKQQLEEWERRFQPDEQSPAKWWTEGGGVDATMPGNGQRFGFHMDSSAMPNGWVENSDHGAAVSLASALSSHSRFRVTDEHVSRDRLREKAQQMEWKRILDEQVRAKEERVQQEVEERRRLEMEEAQEEMRFLQSEQLRAQRKYGFPQSAYSAASPSMIPQNYVAIPSPPAPPKTPRTLAAYQQQFGLQPYDTEQQAESDADNVYGFQGQQQPPPAPSQLATPLRVSDSVDFAFRRNMGLVDAPEPSRDHIVDEYRALLTEIRREREELRRERDELRQEKEELRMERALMQMENEKMATLLESQRRMNEQRLEAVERLTVQSVDHSVLQKSPLGTPYQLQPRTPRTPRVGNARVGDDHGTGELQPLERSLASLGLRRPHGRASPPRVDTRHVPLSMADFAPPENRVVPNVMDSPRARRLARFRHRHENPLEHSLVGESEFVALPTPLDELPPPRIRETWSPSAAMAAARKNAAHGQRGGTNARQALRSSRVIKSRGFYDFEREDAVPTTPSARTLVEHHSPLQTQMMSPSRREAAGTEPASSTRHVTRHVDERRRRYDDSDSSVASCADEASDEDESEDDAHAQSPLSSSLFQVKVLVNE